MQQPQSNHLTGPEMGLGVCGHVMYSIQEKDFAKHEA